MGLGQHPTHNPRFSGERGEPHVTVKDAGVCKLVDVISDGGMQWQPWLDDSPMIEVGLTEGRNRQIRRMTAAVGLPTLRLIRWKIGPWIIDGLGVGDHRSVPTDDAWAALRSAGRI